MLIHKAELFAFSMMASTSKKLLPSIYACQNAPNPLLTHSKLHQIFSVLCNGI